MRKLVEVVVIEEIQPIEGADLIEHCRVQGWWVIAKKGEYKVGDLALYCQIDCWIPTTIAKFLSKGKEPKTYKGISGERLKTIRLKSVLSQGLLLPTAFLGSFCYFSVGDDVSEQLGVVKWEPPEEFVFANQKGNFPYFCPRTDQTRVQSIDRNLEDYKRKGYVFERSEKLHGSSLTVFYRDGEFGVCSRNFELKDEDDNSFWSIAHKYNLQEKMTSFSKNIAIQGELVGPKVCSNTLEFAEFEYFVFDIFDIDKQTYYAAEERMKVIKEFGLKSVPIIGHVSLVGHSINSLLNAAVGYSALNGKVLREGDVYKCVTHPHIHFKAVSNEWLLKYS